jgi:hypothetical protein
MKQLVLAFAFLAAGPLPSCVATAPRPAGPAAGARVYEGVDAEENWVEVDQSSAKASADEFKRWYRAEFGEERYRAEFGEDPK